MEMTDNLEITDIETKEEISETPKNDNTEIIAEISENAEMTEPSDTSAEEISAPKTEMLEKADVKNEEEILENPENDNIEGNAEITEAAKTTAVKVSVPKPDNIEIWLWILLVMLPNNPRTIRILEEYPNAAAAAVAMRNGECKLLNDAEKMRTKTVRNREIKAVLHDCAVNNTRIITLDNPEYPQMLKNTENPPILLFVRGRLDFLSKEVAISVVGTRNNSDYGLRVTHSICTELAKVGTVIVSGLAVGLDSMAHWSAINGGSRTIGVLACGTLVDYPAESAQLKETIILNGGAVISELLPRTNCSPQYFQQRNRIISGLSRGVLITEAGRRSGCLLTASHALEQGRDVFCVPPHDIENERYAGVSMLLHDGAIPCFGYADIINEYLPYYCKEIDPDFIKNYVPLKQRKSDKKPKITIKSEKGEDEKTETSETIQAKPEEPKQPDESVYDSLDPLHADVLRLIAEKQRTLDELIEQTEKTHSEITMVLTELEIMGNIALSPDGNYTLI